MTFFTLSVVCICEKISLRVWAQRSVSLTTQTYKCPHCQNRTASIPLLFGSKLEQWKWVNSSELHLVSFPSCVCKLFSCMGKKKENCHSQLPSVSKPARGSSNFFLFHPATVCINYIGDLSWQSFLWRGKYCQNCAQLVANHLSLLINCMFEYSPLTLKRSKK